LQKVGTSVSFQLIEAIEIFYIIKSIAVGSVGEAVKKTKVFAFQRVLKRNKKEKHKQNRLPVVV
jgi:hypothetical protein